MLSDKKRVLMVGLEPPETTEILEKIDCLTVIYEYLPKIKLVEGILWVESKTHPDKFLKIDKVIYHGVFDDDFDFITLLALWGGECLPNATGMMDCRLRHSGLVRALKATKFGVIPRGMSLEAQEWHAERPTVAKWSNWHCGENKAKFEGNWQIPNEITLYEPFIQGEAVRIVLVEEQAWQIQLTGDDWLKSIHHQNASEMPIDADLLEDAKNLAQYFDLKTVGIDYMVTPDNQKYLLEVNHIPNVTVFSFVREAYINYVVNWCRN